MHDLSRGVGREEGEKQVDSVLVKIHRGRKNRENENMQIQSYVIYASKLRYLQYVSFD